MKQGEILVVHEGHIAGHEWMNSLYLQADDERLLVGTV